MTEGQKKYREYLKSDDWKKKRAQKLRYGATCAVCATRDHLDVHHLTYRRWFDVKKSDLRVLCRRCHALTHECIESGALKYRQGDSNESKWMLTSIAVRKAMARPENRPWSISTGGPFVITKRWILGFASPRGTWSREQLALLGVEPKPKKGWLSGLLGRTISDTVRQKFERAAEHTPTLPVDPGRIEAEHRPLWG